MALLGDDGRGFDLARRLDVSGVWRTWLGDSIYSSFHHCLSSPSTWEAFMRVDESKSRAQIQLQLRVRALLFDKATVSLFLRSNTIAASSSSASVSDVSSVAVSKLNPNCMFVSFFGDLFYGNFGVLNLWFFSIFVHFQIYSFTEMMCTTRWRTLLSKVGFSETE